MKTESVKQKQCWICTSDMPSLKVVKALEIDPTFLDGIDHTGSLSRFDNDSHVCDECGDAESGVGLMLCSLSEGFKTLCQLWLDEAQRTNNREQWKAAIAMIRGSNIGYVYRANKAFETMMSRME